MKKKQGIWKSIRTGVFAVLGVGAVFCIAVLITGGVTGQTFPQVISSWFGAAPAVA